MKFSVHLRPFNEHDEAAFQGAEAFLDGAAPLVADAIPGAPDVTVVMARGAIQVFLGEDNAPYELRVPYRSTTESPDRARSFCEGLFGPGPWELTPKRLEAWGFDRLG